MERPEFRVNFMIVGAQKAGTSALARFLDLHPGICLAAGKEVHLFDRADYSDAWTPGEIDRRYREAFPHWSGERLIGEATPIYLYWTSIAAELRRYNPHLRLLVLLRDPVERALSHYAMERGRGNEPLSLLRALAAEPARLRRDRGNRAEDSSWRLHSYQDRGRYAVQLAQLFRAFPREQVLVLRTERLWDAHEATLREVYRFLGAEPPASLPARERIFAGEQADRGRALARVWLRLRLWRERAWLRRSYPIGR